VKESIWTVSSFINKHATIAGGIRNAIYHQRKKNYSYCWRIRNAIVINKKYEKSTKKMSSIGIAWEYQVQSIINKKK